MLCPSFTLCLFHSLRDLRESRLSLILELVIFSPEVIFKAIIGVLLLYHKFQNFFNSFSTICLYQGVFKALFGKVLSYKLVYLCSLFQRVIAAANIKKLVTS